MGIIETFSFKNHTLWCVLDNWNFIFLLVIGKQVTHGGGNWNLSCVTNTIGYAGFYIEYIKF